MRIFLTGATGVIGRRVVPMLLGTGHEVTAVGRSPSKRAELARLGARPVEVDLFDSNSVRSALANHEVVINLATHLPSSSARMLMPGAWRENDRIRKVASSILSEAATASGTGWFVQESFAPIYADGGDAWIDESWPLRPARYNRTVLDAERSAERFTTSGGTGVVLRFGLFYGPDAFQIIDFIRMVRRGRAPVFGEEGYVSSISHDDAASAVVAALGVGPGAYNVVDNEPLRRREWVDSLATALRAPPPKVFPRWLSRLGGSLTELLARSQRISNRKFREVSGWAPRYPSVREGWPVLIQEIEAR